MEVVIREEETPYGKITVKVNLYCIKTISVFSNAEIEEILKMLGREDGFMTVEELKAYEEDQNPTIEQRIQNLIEKGYTKDEAKMLVKKLIENKLI